MNREIIDVHTHWCAPFEGGLDAWAKRHGEAYWNAMFAPGSLMTFPTMDEFLNDMDEGGVSRAVIQGIFWESTSACQSQNKGVSKFVEKHPDRISAFAAINPSDLKGSLEIIKNARNMGFCGVGELGDYIQGFSFLEPGFEEIVCACAEKKLPICIHFNDNEGPDYPGKYVTKNADFFELASRHSKATFIAAHFAGYDIFRNIKPSSNIYFDSAATLLFYSPAAWSIAAETYPDNVVFGSDYAMKLYPAVQQKADFKMILEDAFGNIPKEKQSAFLRENALRIIEF
jgi:predicted TIM-barrel fold metal-dependent hydrolase